MEVQVPWNPDQVFSDLQAACQILSERGLKLAAKWAAEQLMGLPTPSHPQHAAFPHLKWQEETATPHYARTLMDLGEYAHAASVLSEPPTSNSVLSVPPPSTDLSPAGFALRAYALYMAGEAVLENNRDDKKAKNPHVQQLQLELQQAYEQERLDAFGLHVYGMVLKKTNARPSDTTPQAILMQSILQFPYNWSAWLDLAEIALQDATVEKDIDAQLGSVLGENFCFHFFCAHLQAQHQAHAEALRIYERWLDLLGGSPYVATQAAVTQYHLRLLAPAKALLEDLHSALPYRLDAMDVYSNILYVQEDSVQLAQLAHQAVQVDPHRPETCCIVGNYYSLKQDRAKAISYFRRALQLDPTFTSAWTLMGHEYVEWKQTAHAMEAYRRAVQVNAQDYRAWYGLGQTYELLELYFYALHYYQRAAQLRPTDARMWTAVGHAYCQLRQLPQAIRAYERAVQQTDAEGVATHKLAFLYQETGQRDKAAQCFAQYLDNRQVDKLLEAPEAEALHYLAQYYRENGDYEEAAMLATLLLEYPGPEKEEAKALLRELRARKNRQMVNPSVFEFSP